MRKPVPGGAVQEMEISPPNYASPRRSDQLQEEESSNERGVRLGGSIDDQWGRSESLDPDNVGDIADEGVAHRG